MLRLQILLFSLANLMGLLFGLSMCQAASQNSASSPQAASVEITLAPESALPDFVQDAAPQVKEAYRFAIANPEVLRQFPCYCGCGAMGQHEKT